MKVLKETNDDVLFNKLTDSDSNPPTSCTFHTNAKWHLMNNCENLVASYKTALITLQDDVYLPEKPDFTLQLLAHELKLKR